MPTSYLPTVREHGVIVVKHPSKPNTWTKIVWAEDNTVETSTILCTKPESVVDSWEKNFLRLGDRRADWEFHHEPLRSSSGRIIGQTSRAVAVPAYLTTADRIDLLLSRIFQHSCAAMDRGDHARVQHWDDRADAIHLAYYGTVV